MGRYYYGDIQGKFMFAVQSSNAGERFGAQEEEAMTPYFVNRKFYDHIVKELESIEQSGSVDRVNKMFDNEMGYDDDTLKQYGVSKDDLSEFADYRLGMNMKEWFDANPDLDWLRYEAEAY